MPPSVPGWRAATCVVQSHTQSSGTKRKAEAISQDTARPPLFAPWTADIAPQPHLPAIEILNLEAASFTRYITPTKVEQKVRHLVIEWIRNEIVRHIPDAEVLVFGSTPVDMYLPSGDIDLVVQSKSLAVEGPPRSNITRIADILRSTDMALGEVRIFASAKIPILKFVSRHGKFSIDISVNVSNGVAAASIIRDFIRDIPGVKPLSLIVKCFLRSRDANEVYRGGLSSYLVVCMVIYFFQTHKGMRKSHTDPSSSLGNLLLEFLQLFGYDFNYLQSGISLRDGGKTFSRSERHWIYRPSQPRLCIEDPQNTQLDAGAGIHDIRRIQMLFIHAYDQLQAEIQRRDRSRSKALLLEGNSLLQIIMGVPLNEIEHRKYLAVLHTTGRLYRLLNMPRTGQWIKDAKENDPPPALPATRLDLNQPTVHSAVYART